MDPKRLKKAYNQLQALDERLTYRVRPRSGGGLSRPGIEQVDERLRDLANYTVELKEIVQELILAVGTRPKKSENQGGGTAKGAAETSTPDSTAPES